MQDTEVKLNQVFMCPKQSKTVITGIRISSFTKSLGVGIFF